MDNNPTDEKAVAKHVCHCGKEFLRKEHLTRHQATHTKPSFVCHICQRSFTRSDVLRRHVGRHVTASGSASGPMAKARACDACHANKTKCSGGLNCSLCENRGINCTYDRPDVRGSASAPAGVSEEEPSSSTATDLATSTLELDPGLSALPRSRQLALFLSSLTIQPDPAAADIPYPSPPDDESFDPYAGMQVIRHGIITGEQILERACAKCEKFQEWVSSLWATYLDRCHDHWAFLMVTVFDIAQAPFTLSASILITAVRLQEGNPVDLTDLILECHDLLVEQLLRELTNDVHGDRAWPYDLYYATLLNILFALNSGVEKHITKGRLLCTVFVDHLRGVGMFDSVAAEHMADTFFPGTYLPYKLGVVENRNKVVACLFKAVAYVSLQGDSIPQLSVEELDAGLPQSFGLRNSWGIMVWYKRLPDEPADRSSLKLSDVVSGKTEPSTLLVEDIELGLCGMTHSLWKYSQDRRTGLEDPFSREALSNQLALWKADIDGLLHICGIQAGRDTPGSNEADFPLCAYRGDDDENPDGWKALALGRVTLMAQYATILFHLLSLHLYADIGLLNGATDSQVSQPVGDQDWQHVTTAVNEWKSRKAPKEGGLAMMHALAIIRTVEAVSLRLNVPANRLEPVARLGLEASLKILEDSHRQYLDLLVL